MKYGSIPVKVYNKGIYNPISFKRDYYANSYKSKTVANYSSKSHQNKVTKRDF